MNFLLLEAAVCVMMYVKLDLCILLKADLQLVESTQTERYVSIYLDIEKVTSYYDLSRFGASLNNITLYSV